MKKILAFVLAVAMLLCFAACAQEPKETATEENKGAANTEVKTEEKTEEKTEIKTVKEGKLIMGTNAYFQPYEYYEGDKIIGIDAEIAAKIAEKLGLELEIQDMAFDSIITAVNEGSVDMGLAGMTVNEDRLKDVDFSISYASGVQAIVVPENSPIKSVDDLYAEGAAYKVGTQLGTTGDIYSTDDFGDELVTSFTTGNEAINALLGGDVDCVIIDNEPAKAFVKNNAGLKVLETSYADEDYAACIKKGNDALRAAIDEAIEELIEDGTVESIIDKYIK